jgi:phospholipase/carboxylesterase
LRLNHNNRINFFSLTLKVFTFMAHPAHISGPVRKPRSGGAPKQLVILLHGWGADGANLIDLADMFTPVLPDALFVAPNAPFPCEANPFGYQWFSLMDRHPQHMLEGVKNAAHIVDHYIDHQLEALSLTNDKVILVGFSQGTMTALHVALRRTPQSCGPHHQASAPSAFPP